MPHEKCIPTLGMETDDVAVLDGRPAWCCGANVRGGYVLSPFDGADHLHLTHDVALRLVRSGRLHIERAAVNVRALDVAPPPVETDMPHFRLHSPKTLGRGRTRRSGEGVESV